MASLAQDRVSGQDGSAGAARGKAARAPLSTHPAFPFIVGLWFAALLGIGSLVVPVPLIERLVEMTGLAAIVPQTAPPLGFTARALIALVCTVGGGLTGLLIARKVGQAHAAPKVRKDRGQLAARRPISAHDELGEDGFDGNTPRGRRSLAIVEEEGPSEVFEMAPLPGKSLPLSALDLDEVEALELADAAMIAEEPAPQDAPEDGASDGPMPGFTTLADYAADAAPHEMAGEDFSMAERQHFRLDTFGQTVGAPIQPRQQFVLDPTPPAPEAPASAESAAPEADLHFSPPSLARPFAAPDAQPDPGAQDTEEAEMDDFAEPAGLEPVVTPPNAAPAADWQDGELDDLALVQLAQRLGSSIARRREQRAAAAAAAAVAASAVPAAVPAAAPAVLAEDFDAAEAAEAAQAMAAYFGSPAQPVAAGAPAAPAFGAPAFVQTQEAEPASVVTPLAQPSAAPAAPAANRQVFRPVEFAPAPQPAPLANLAQIDLGEDEEDEDEHIAHLTASFSLPLAGKAPAAVVVEDKSQDEEDAFVAPAGPAPFANPFQQKAQPFVRIEDEPQPEDGAIEPAVVFPGEARAEARAESSPASALENERALREALLSLQRMSGVA